MKLLGNNEDNADRPQIRTSQDDAAVGYGFHQENEFPAFVQKRWAGTDDAIVDVNISFSLLPHSFSNLLRLFQPLAFCLILFINAKNEREKKKVINSFSSPSIH